jgi:hypothetical protein
MYARQMHMARMWLFADAALNCNSPVGITVNKCY